MSSISFFKQLFPELAAAETRELQVPILQGRLPQGTYLFTEAYCTDMACDCRVAYITVVNKDEPYRPLATITYGWESIKFYCRWMGLRKPDPELIAFKGPDLMPMAPQSNLSGDLLTCFKTTLRAHPEYVGQLKRHYTIFKEKIARAHGLPVTHRIG